MTRSWAAALILLVGLGAFIPYGSADNPPIDNPDHQDILVLADSGPILVRLRPRIDGKSFPAAWESYLDKLFADLDRDGDGFLSKDEASRMPSADFLQSFLQGGLNLEAATNTASFAQLDSDGDCRVSRREFSDYYRRCGFSRPRAVLVPDRTNSAALTDALFDLLDLDHDGKLSKDELKKAGDTLRRVDWNEDEWITPDELLLNRPAPKAGSNAKAPTLETAGLIPLEPTGLNKAQTQAVLAHYKSGNKLDVRALTALLARPPDLEVSVRLGKLGKDEARIEVTNPAMPLAKAARSTEDGGLRVPFGGLTLELHPGPPDRSMRGLHSFYRQQFDAADADKRGFIELKQVADVATLTALFRLADRDGDGKLTEKEFSAFLELHELGASSYASLVVTDQSLGLFDLLDENHDGRLSLRELFTAWDRLRGYDRDGDGKLSRDEFPRQLRARLDQGKANLRPDAQARATAMPVKRSGPAWFQKMDRNGDGYVSRREFLGSEELFNKLDTDGDGLISPEEAEHAPK